VDNLLRKKLRFAHKPSLPHYQKRKVLKNAIRRSWNNFDLFADPFPPKLTKLSLAAFPVAFRGIPATD
jgi:hypothetical protein